MAAYVRYRGTFVFSIRFALRWLSVLAFVLVGTRRRVFAAELSRLLRLYAAWPSLRDSGRRRGAAWAMAAYREERKLFCGGYSINFTPPPSRRRIHLDLGCCSQLENRLHLHFLISVCALRRVYSSTKPAMKVPG